MSAHPIPTRRQFRCGACGRSVGVTPDGLLRYASGRAWPACCGEPMALLVGDRRVRPHEDTALERPALARPDPGRAD